MRVFKYGAYLTAIKSKMTGKILLLMILLKRQTTKAFGLLGVMMILNCGFCCILKILTLKMLIICIEQSIMNA